MFDPSGAFGRLTGSSLSGSTVPPKLIFHERQQAALCGQHCLNNLLQSPLFTAADLADIAHGLDAEEAELLGGSLAGESSNVDESGNFSVSVLSRAIERSHGLRLRTTPAIVESALRQPTDHEAFVLNHHAHWFTIRRLHGTYWDLNSTRALPRPISDFYLAAYLGQMRADGYSIFVVEPHAKLPPPPANRSVGPAGTVHEAAVLQTEAAKASRRHEDAAAAARHAAASDPELAAALEASRAALEDGAGGRAGPSGDADEEERQLQRALALSVGGGGRAGPSGADDVTAEEMEAARAAMPGADLDTLRAVALSMRPPASSSSSSSAAPSRPATDEAAVGPAAGASSSAAASPAPPPECLPTLLARLDAAFSVLGASVAEGGSTRARLSLPGAGAPLDGRFSRRAHAAAVVAWAYASALRAAFPGSEAAEALADDAAPGVREAAAEALAAAREAEAATGIRVSLDPEGTPLIGTVEGGGTGLPGSFPTVETAGLQMKRLSASPRR